MNIILQLYKMGIKILLLFVLFSFLCTGCKNENVSPPISIDNVNWILIDAKLYIKRWGDYPLYQYDLFKVGQTYNCVDLNGNPFLLDQIYKDSTKFKFTGWNKPFYLNDSIQYETQYTKAGGVGETVVRVFPTEDGSARIFMFECYKENYCKWTTSNREQALILNGVYDNCTYYTKLIFRREGTNTPYEMCDDPESSIYAGVIPAGVQKSKALAKHTWVIYQYKKSGFNTYQTISDTMYFLNNYNYYYVTKLQMDGYALYDMSSYYTLSLDHTRFGSNITCSNIPKFQLDNGDIQQATFKDNTIGTGGDSYDLFIRKIQ